MKRFESKFVKACLTEIETTSADSKCITFENLCRAVASTQNANHDPDPINPDDEDDQLYTKLCVKTQLVKTGAVKVVIGVGGGLILAGVEPNRKGTSRAVESVDADTVQRVLECIKTHLPKHPKGIATTFVAGALDEDPARVAAAVAQLPEYVIRRPSGIVPVELAAELDKKASERAAKKAAASETPA